MVSPFLRTLTLKKAGHHVKKEQEDSVKAAFQKCKILTQLILVTIKVFKLVLEISEQSELDVCVVVKAF